MHLQNRVTPFGDIVAISQRGMFTGNRGIIHDPSTRTLLRKRWASKAWLVCSCSYKGQHREVMATRSWTELFFLDEAVALAAGHRPCFLCRRPAAEAYRACWAIGTGEAFPSARRIDAVLHAERLDRRAKRLHRVTMLSDLPNGAVIAQGEEAFTLHGGCAYRWTNEGYARPQTLKSAEWLLTPPSTVKALRAGYVPLFHPTIATNSDEQGHA
ncbi:hypothetical protein [Rhizobium lusitanum]|uniref:Uncharacterized protein n=1 Tax=Rhizobium lusitanum TaxID=293958 RepID=A0A7X0MD67_9HYPH|nr:hypothetical protein [Rhizobium lusitanum]MBB6486126.1 hypothetical protein [Rhizobium lusitanum]